MAEKKVTKAAATKAATKAAKAAAPKKACAKKACAAKPAAKVAKKAAAPKKAAAKVVYVNAENAGWKAGDIYQTLSSAAKAMTPAEIAKAAKCTVEEVYLGIGWLFKEGKIVAEENKIALA